MNKKKGLLVIISGPSGSGKGTINHVIAEHPDVFLSVSATTRQPREGEIHGVHYYFISQKEFQQRLKEGGIMEYNEYCGNYYGTPKREVEKKLEEGKHVILEIDVNGALQVMEQNDTVSIFIMPPSLSILEQRLRGRGTEAEDVIQQRLKEAISEIKQAHHYDYIVVNDALDDAVHQIKAIITAEQCKTNVMKDFIEGVLQDEHE